MGKLEAMGGGLLLFALFGMFFRDNRNIGILGGGIILIGGALLVAYLAFRNAQDVSEVFNNRPKKEVQILRQEAIIESPAVIEQAQAEGWCYDPKPILFDDGAHYGVKILGMDEAGNLYSPMMGDVWECGGLESGNGHGICFYPSILDNRLNHWEKAAASRGLAPVLAMCKLYGEVHYNDSGESLRTTPKRSTPKELRGGRWLR